jgi:Heterokaryon incompatibility protein (HET)
MKNHIPKCHIVDIDNEIKARLFTNNYIFNAQYDNLEILQRIRDMSSSLADEFMERKIAQASFQLRLHIDDDGSTHEPISYIAMSYRWRDPPTAPPPSNHVHLPVAREIFAAVSSLALPGEGLWFDTGCIRQDDETEKQIAIGFMDMLYKNARKVIIVLWDVGLNEEEVDLLQTFQEPFAQACEEEIQPQMKGFGFPPYLNGIQLPGLNLHAAFLEFGKKILMSEYFERAFCSQEFRVARQCCFLLPCERTPSEGSFSFCTLDFSFVSLVANTFAAALQETGTLAASSQRVSSVDYMKVLGRAVTVQGLLSRKAYRNLGESVKAKGMALESLDVDLQATLRSDSLSQSFADIFSMQAGGNPKILDGALRKLDANRDRLLLTLNSVEHPLTIVFKQREPHPPLTTDRCLTLLTALALASSDALALCGRGGKLDMGPGRSSWIQRPKRHMGDTLSGPGARLDTRMRMLLGEERGHEYIQLGLQFLDEVPLPQDSINKAQHFVRVCHATGAKTTIVQEQGIDPRHPYWSQMQEFKLYALSSLFSSSNHAELAAILCNQPFNESCHVTEDILAAALEDDFSVKSTAFANPDPIRQVAAAFFAFMDHLMTMLLPSMDELTFEYLSWRPRQAVFAGHSSVLVAPPQARVAVPDPLKWRECRNLSRCWLLVPRYKDDDAWALLGAAHLYASQEFAAKLEESEARNELSRVFGEEGAASRENES